MKRAYNPATGWKEEKTGVFFSYYIGERRVGAIFRKEGKWYSWFQGSPGTVDWGHLRGKIDRVKRYVEAAVKNRMVGVANPSKKSIGVGYKRKVIHHPGTPGKREPWIEYKIVRSYTKKSNPGSVSLIVPLTRKAKFWVDRNVGLEPWQWMGPGFAVEWRYVDNLVEGMEDSGLVKGKDFDVN
jgi:hypothetical protein